MTRSGSCWLGWIAVTGAAAAVAHACGGTETPGPEAPAITGVAVSMYDAGSDMARCDFKGRGDREVSEAAGAGASAPNVRRVYAVIGQGEDSRRVLICREVDTNLDGMKDVVRIYSDQGEAIHEHADTNYDGRIDTWITFAGGRISRLEVDTNHDGRPNEIQHFIDGTLSRIERDTNRNGKSDVWEIYANGRLQRMGVDLDHDGHIDRWDRDEVAVREVEAREREAEERRGREQGGQEVTDGGVVDARVSARNR